MLLDRFYRFSWSNLSDLLLSNRFFSICCMLSSATYGMCWTIPGTLIYDIKLNINQNMEMFGYLMMFMKLGKLCGHLLFALFTKCIIPKYYSHIHLISFFVMCIGTILVPFCLSWISLGLNFFLLIGIQFGIIESNLSIINTTVNGNDSKKFTNIYYFCFSVGCCIVPLIVSATKQTIESTLDDHKQHLSICCWVVGGIIFVYDALLYLLFLYREHHGVYLEQTKVNQLEEGLDKPNYFRRPIISTLALLVTSFTYMCARTILDVYLLPYAMNADANLDEIQSYTVLQTTFTSSVVARLIVIFVAYYCRRTWLILIICNANVLLSVVSMLIFEDKTYAGIIVTMILFGISNGIFQNSLLNWLIDMIRLSPTNTAPFFMATVLGSTSTPAVFPHVIKNKDGSTNIEAYMLSIIIAFTIASVSCVILMIFEHSSRQSLSEIISYHSRSDLERDISEVKMVQILPSKSGYEDDVSSPVFRAKSKVSTFRQRKKSVTSILGSTHAISPPLSIAPII